MTHPTTRCHSCGAEITRTFYEVRDIPVHSCLMVGSRDAALAFPTGDLSLDFCASCGFVQNDAFDASVHEYSQQYEETQAFSPRFLEFQDGLIERLLRDFDLRGKSVLEIGCGKGEFLVRMCELGGGSGIGIDPGYRPERTQSEAADRIEFINDFYGEDYAHLQADVVVCRHTLEHIQPAKEFVDLVRRTIADRRDVTVFFEVPDVYRVLEEQAFWDLYYEHCSYFSFGSLARLFRACRFDVQDLWTGFDDQYLMLVATPGDGRGGKRFEAENDLDAMTAAVDRYERELPAKQAEWRDRVMRVVSGGGRVAIWGSGSKCIAWLTGLGLRDEIGCIVDINPHKHGKFLAGTGHEIAAPETLKEFGPDLVIVMNPIYLEEIGRDCVAMGIDAELVAV